MSDSSDDAITSTTVHELSAEPNFYSCHHVNESTVLCKSAHVIPLCKVLELIE